MISNKYIFEQIEDIIKDEAGCEYWDDCISCEYECFVKKILNIINKVKGEGEMPIALLLLWLTPIPVAVVGMQQEYTKEQKVIELCTQKFNTPQEIQQCKAVLMEIER